MDHVSPYTPDPRPVLQRVLEEPGLVAAVQNLPSRALAKLIGHVGLEDAGPLIALASRNQLQRVFDEDLWHGAKPGKPEVFETGRFGLWLEVMAELGEDFTLQALETMDEDFLVMALSRLVWVMENQALADQVREDPDGEGAVLEKVLESNLRHEFEDYWVLAREEDAWDVVVRILTDLDGRNRDLFVRLMERCAALTMEAAEAAGSLGEVLSGNERLDNDVADAREARRELEGYVAPEEAASFLALARTVDPDAALSTPPDDPVMCTYLRKGLQEIPAEPVRTEATPVSLLLLLKESGALPATRKGASPALTADPPPTTTDPPTDPGVPPSRFQQALTDLSRKNPAVHEQRMRELLYLANVLVSGESLKGRPMRAGEAAQAALAACDAGLEYLLKKEPGAARPLEEHDCIQLFRAGYMHKS